MFGIIARDDVSYEGKLYKYNWGVYTDRHGKKQTLFILSSCARQTISEFVGHKCVFRVTLDGCAYNIGLVDENNNVVSI
jgi:hypothetical protein